MYSRDEEEYLKRCSRHKSQRDCRTLRGKGVEVSSASFQVIADLLAEHTGQQLTECRKWRVSTALSRVFREFWTATSSDDAPSDLLERFRCQCYTAAEKDVGLSACLELSLPMESFFSSRTRSVTR